MQTPDVVNGSFETIGAAMCWLNVHKITKDKKVVGLYWPVQAFFSVWGVWNLYYYPSLGQWASFLGGALLVMGNTTWTLLAAYYSKRGGEQQ
jgi:hypothetical protein